MASSILLAAKWSKLALAEVRKLQFFSGYSMGDRAHVTLTILAEHADLFDTLEGNTGWDTRDAHADIVCYQYEEVNYGDLAYADSEFFDRMTNLGIACEAEWSAGHEYGQGNLYVRFDHESKVVHTEIYDMDMDMNIASLLRVIKSDDKVFKKYVKLRSLIKRHESQTYVIPWKDQAARGLIHRTRTLIGAKNS